MSSCPKNSPKFSVKQRSFSALSHVPGRPRRPRVVVAPQTFVRTRRPSSDFADRRLSGPSVLLRGLIATGSSVPSLPPSVGSQNGNKILPVLARVKRRRRKKRVRRPLGEGGGGGRTEGSGFNGYSNTFACLPYGGRTLREN